jgi:hypothetical protein
MWSDPFPPSQTPRKAGASCTGLPFISLKDLDSNKKQEVPVKLTDKLKVPLCINNNHFSIEVLIQTKMSFKLRGEVEYAKPHPMYNRVWHMEQHG